MKWLYTVATLLVGVHISAVQKNGPKDYLITTPIYNERFESINPAAEVEMAAYLKGKNLEYLITDGVISRVDMRDFALPLGVHGNDSLLSYQRGMQAMWVDKLKRNAVVLSRKPELKNELDALMAEAMNRFQEGSARMNLDTYRAMVLKPVLDTIRAYHQQMQPLYSPERRRFMDLLVANMSANVLLGYSIHELIPPTHFTETKEKLPVNPLFKTFYFDRMLQEAGTEFISYFPARYDPLLSFGPYQFTNIALRDIQSNPRLVASFKVYESTKDLTTIQDHALAAAIFTYNNWERFSMLLNSRGVLKKFNDEFADNIDTRNLRIFIAGMTACLHHQPPVSMNLLAKKISESDNLSTLYYTCLAKEDNAQLAKVYRSAAEAYLFLKVHDTVFADK
ncbi:hypothetical protein GCM10023187_51910 [Nibrella viscosa]|uniref:Uncharacterized protein n=1 Tax=Nibrella viscosa TaxID=1084524 RepID=A0ABP8KYB3_9BACT